MLNNKQSSFISTYQQYGRVGVIYGGDSAERAISLISGKTVLDALNEMGIEAVGIDALGIDLIRKLQMEKVSRCIIMLHGNTGENGHVQALLDTMNMPYSGSGMLASALSMDKRLSKQIWQANHIKVPAFQLLFDQEQTLNLELPCVIKPVAEGSSIGITKVNNKEEIADAFEKAARYGRVMAEEWIEGEEYTVAIANARAFPSTKLVSKHEFYDYKAKYEPGITMHYCPSDLSSDEEKHIRQLALKASFALEVQGCARIDFIRNKKDQLFYILEINTIPGMTKLSLFPEALIESGMSFNDVVLTYLDSTFNT